MKFFINFLQGIALGTAEIIPGVSGSTIALLLGIYDDFIDLLYQASEVVKVGLMMLVGKKSVSDLIAQLRAIRWRFGILLLIGMLTAIASLSTIMDVLLFEYPQYLFAVLLGLTPPTMAIVFQQMEKPGKKEYLISVVTAVVLLGIFVFGTDTSGVTNPHPLHLFLGGMVAVSTMVLPGVSGSFMLLVLGLYNFVIGMIADLSSGQVTTDSLTSIGFLFAGVVVGFMTTVRLLKVAFQKFRNQLMAFLFGLLAASWYVLWPLVTIEIPVDGGHHDPELIKVGLSFFSPVELLIIAGLTVGTSVITWYLHRWADTHDPESKQPDSGFDKV